MSNHESLSAMYRQIPEGSRPIFSTHSLYKYLYQNKLLGNQTNADIDKFVNSTIDSELKKFYYSPGGFMGLKALYETVNNKSPYRITEKDVKNWLDKQHVSLEHRPLSANLKRITVHFDIDEPNHTHQLDSMVMPHDGHYSRILCLIDVASRFKAAEPLMDNSATECLRACKRLYQNNKKYGLKVPKIMMTDNGSEFKGKFSEYWGNQGVRIRYAVVNHHQTQSLVENFNRSLATRLFKHMEHRENQAVAESGTHVKDYGVDISKHSHLVNNDWVANLQPVVDQLNSETVSTIHKKPEVAIQMDSVPQPKNTPEEIATANKETFNLGDLVKYYLDYHNIIQGPKRRATDRTWSNNIYEVDDIIEKPGQPKQYWLIDHVTGHPLGFYVIGTRLVHVKDTHGEDNSNHNSHLLEYINDSVKDEIPIKYFKKLDVAPVRHSHNTRYSARK